ncbi:MAG: 5-oxoprolinase subunit PxpA [Corynebacterium sp.]|nr:5-oxoprolinase subunit PxpA [Corynebacterium sp.]
MVDLNADLGESFGSYRIGNDDIISIVDRANIACGFHAGDPLVIKKACQQATEAGALIGAHVGYRDLAGFGRRFIAYDPATLQAEIEYQIGALSAFGEVSYVKPHGALYNYACMNKDQAMPIIHALLAYDPALSLMCLANSPIIGWAEEAGLATISEAFADRAYNPDGTLVARSQPGAVLRFDDALAQARSMIEKESADSICVHGDSEGALKLAHAIREVLDGV